MAKSQSFEETYTNLAHFIDCSSGGWIELGDSEHINAFARAYDMGGTIYEGKSLYNNDRCGFTGLRKAPY